MAAENRFPTIHGQNQSISDRETSGAGRSPTVITTAVTQLPPTTSPAITARSQSSTIRSATTPYCTSPWNRQHGVVTDMYDSRPNLTTSGSRTATTATGVSNRQAEDPLEVSM